MFPVFSLVLDEDVPADIALIYPELYKDLSKVGNKCFPTLVIYVFYYSPLILQQRQYLNTYVRFILHRAGHCRTRLSLFGF